MLQFYYCSECGERVDADSIHYLECEGDEKEND
ncbi:hypothetical protein CPT_Mater226 [Bacillus phage Mater]|uniref:Uncharacterized protein n=1 Tax=Bacillus phage Mater TaxID=1540090 RepID=A0A0A0RRR9_9CAUD|nr:hypothetical protein CPT_Mater4 [Bacillus phage Mater]YP_009151185.1 hypothetical protein CPT_Mater226 [Bacillus phage Mater]AIW03161.1 hypothetical protein CPT_Mater4 [Bacillus phage Mater]AIW03383.1 hypothetical protein CPT_Mater226 [Bacillus phage Mater]